VPVTERTARIELIEDLVIEPRGDDPNYIFYRPGHVIADAEGRVFVMERGNYRIQVFDPSGDYLMTLGREGQGPGEFARLNGIAVVGDSVVAVDNRNARFTMFGPAGDLLATIPKEPSTGTVLSLMADDSGTLLAYRLVRPTDQELNLLISRYGLLRLSEEMTPLNEVFRFPEYSEPMVSRGAGTDESAMMARSVMLPYPYPDAVASVTGAIYASQTSEYQVHRFSADGRMAWALRVAWERAPVTEAEIEEELARIRSVPALADFRRSEFDWPELRPAIDRLLVDGRGNLYVILYPAAGENDSGERMVDVYSPAGEHLFSGWMSEISWDSARGEFVYDIRSDDETGDQSVVRYRPVTPF
jgi:hypothetical protein